MMIYDIDNETLLGEVQRRVETGQLAAERVSAMVGTPSDQAHAFSITKLLYIIGGVIVSLGLVFFIGQIWNDIGAVGRILVTFGLGMLLAWYGTHFMRTKPEARLGDVFHAIAGLLLPGGAVVILDETVSSIDSMWPFIFIFGAVAAFYLLLLRLFTNSILVFYAIGNATVAGTLLFVELFPQADEQVYLLYVMTVGVVYVYLAHAFRDDWNRYLLVLLNVLGAGAFYIAAFFNIFEGELFWNSGHSVFWELLFPVLAIGGMVGAIWVQSRSLLFITTVALTGYIIYLTAEYFADSVGWPLALVVLGFVIIGIGYGSINLGKKYIR